MLYGGCILIPLRLVGWWVIGRWSVGPVIGHGLMLLLSIAKWHDLLNSQPPVYDGDRQTPPDLSNLLPEGTDSDPDT